MKNIEQRAREFAAKELDIDVNEVGNLVGLEFAADFARSEIDAGVSAALAGVVDEYEDVIKACHGLTTQYGTLVPQAFFEIRYAEHGTAKGYWLIYNSYAEIIGPDFDTALDAWRWLNANRDSFVPNGEGFMGAHPKAELQPDEQSGTHSAEAETDKQEDKR